MDTRLRVLLVDGHAGVSAALAKRLCAAPSIMSVATAPSLEVALQRTEEATPTVVLYDPRTVAGDAGAAVQALAGRGGAVVVVLTSSLHTDEPAALLRAGAAAIVFKGTPLTALLARLQDVLAERQGRPQQGTKAR